MLNGSQNHIPSSDAYLTPDVICLCTGDGTCKAVTGSTSIGVFFLYAERGTFAAVAGSSLNVRLTRALAVRSALANAL